MYNGLAWASAAALQMHLRQRMVCLLRGRSLATAGAVATAEVSSEPNPLPRSLPSSASL
jgi:hypothetical protein